MQQGTETRRNLSLSLVEFPHPRVRYNYTNPVGDKQKQKQLAAWHTGPPEGVLELLLAKNPSCFRLSKLASREHAFLYSRSLFRSAQPTTEGEGELMLHLESISS